MGRMEVKLGGMERVLEKILSGDTLFHLTSQTPPTFAWTFPSTPSLTFPHTADSLDNLSQYNSNTSTPSAVSNNTLELTILFPFFPYHATFNHLISFQFMYLFIISVNSIFSS